MELSLVVRVFLELQLQQKLFDHLARGLHSTEKGKASHNNLDLATGYLQSTRE
jgi:hypothetical protein